MVKHLPTMQETGVWPLGGEDPLEKEMAIHSSTLAWKIPWKEEPVGYSPWGCKESDMTEQLHFHFKLKKREEDLERSEKVCAWQGEWAFLVGSDGKESAC